MKDDESKPWRASFTKVARCGMCAFYAGFNAGKCSKGRTYIYPLITGEHHCKDYIHNRDQPRFFTKPEYPLCKRCGHWFNGRCDGIRWWPHKTEPCEFFRDRRLTCRNAIPMSQYGDHNRNNYCKLPPRLRDGDSSRGWKWLCPNAHTEYVTGLKCYKPKVRLCRKEG